MVPIGTKFFQCPSCWAMKGVMEQFVVFDQYPVFSCTRCDGAFWTAILHDNRSPCLACAECGHLINALDLFPP